MPKKLCNFPKITAIFSGILNIKLNICNFLEWRVMITEKNYETTMGKIILKDTNSFNGENHRQYIWM